MLWSQNADHALTGFKVLYVNKTRPRLAEDWGRSCFLVIICVLLVSNDNFWIWFHCLYWLKVSERRERHTTRENDYFLIFSNMTTSCFSLTCQFCPISTTLGFPFGSAGKESTCNVGDLGSIPGLGRSPGEGKGYPLHGLYSPWCCKESDTTERLSLSLGLENLL